MFSFIESSAYALRLVIAHDESSAYALRLVIAHEAWQRDVTVPNNVETDVTEFLSANT